MIPEWLDFTAVVVGALSGVLTARERSLDLVGFMALCLICALGGGILRDVLMQVGTENVYCLSSRWAIRLCVLTALGGFFFPSIKPHKTFHEWVDIITVAFFVAAGADKASSYGLYFEGVVLMGTITGIGGGMLRDVFLGDVPRLFKRSNWYALCAVAGATVFWFFIRVLHARQSVAMIVCVVVVVALRRISLHFQILSPEQVDLRPRSKKPASMLHAACAGASYSAAKAAKPTTNPPTSRTY